MENIVDIYKEVSKEILEVLKKEEVDNDKLDACFEKRQTLIDALNKKNKIEQFRKVYKEKYEFALNCINKYIKSTFIWGEGGLHIYVGIEGINARELLEKCYEKGVIFTPGDIFSIDDRCKSTLRLGLSRLNLNQIEEGIKIIGEVKKKLEK